MVKGKTLIGNLNKIGLEALALVLGPLNYRNYNDINGLRGLYGKLLYGM